MLAVCLHQTGDIQSALINYRLSIDISNNTFALPYANLASVSISNADAETAALLAREYLRGVGDPLGSGEPEFDADSLVLGTPCRGDALNRMECVMALNNLGAALLTMKDKGAEEVLRMAVGIAGAEAGGVMAEVYFNMGTVRMEEGDVGEAAEFFARSFMIKLADRGAGLDPGVILRRGILLPPVVEGKGDVADIRRMFKQRVEALVHLAEWGSVGLDRDVLEDLLPVPALPPDLYIPPLKHSVPDIAKGLQTPHFYLHYHGGHDRPMQELVAGMLELYSHPTISEPSPHLSLPPSGPKVRIGFISSLLADGEPHGLLLQGLISSLPPDKFHKVAMTVGKPLISQDIMDSVHEVHSFGFNYHVAVASIKDLRLDVLVYGEMQNEALVHALGLSRLARTQVLVMGSPVTSGARNVDYFISADRVEHPFRTMMTAEDEHYTEQVVLLGGQGISYPAPVRPAEEQGATFWRDHFELDVGGRAVYSCAQHLFKLHPEFDDIITGVLQADPAGIVVLQRAKSEAKTQIIRDRIGSSVGRVVCGIGTDTCRASEEMMERVKFLKRVPRNVFLEMLRLSSVVLHPFPFGGSKTSSDALLMGTPIVVYPQVYLRGRMAQGFYYELSRWVDNVSFMECCLASSEADYVSKVVRLGRDAEYRRTVSAAIRGVSERLFDVKSIEREWMRFLERALGIDLGVGQELLAEDVGWDEEVMRDIQRRWRHLPLRTFD